LLLALLPLDLSGPASVSPKRTSTETARRHLDPPRQRSIADPAGGTLTIALRASIASNPRGVAIEIEHRWSGPPERFLERDDPGCSSPHDFLLVDGVPRALVGSVCGGPSPPRAQVIGRGGTWTTGDRIVLSPGRHRLRAIYRVDEKQAAPLDRADTVIHFLGEARSNELVLEVPAR
jgi:hypothetical protein